MEQVKEMEQVKFGLTKNGKEATKYFISNDNGMRVGIINYGAAIASVEVKDKDGKVRDVVLGYDDVTGYENGGCFFGATVGRNCNRIANSQVEIDGVSYKLEANDNENNLHSASKGCDKLMWDLVKHEENKLVLSCVSHDLEQGFPGELKVEVTFEVTEDNGLSLSYSAVSDKKTVINFTNHSYFNLGGHDCKDVLNQKLQLKSSHYTPVIDQKSIPTGEIASVEGTPFDFREAKEIGRDIENDFEQLKFGTGYDHNMVIDKEKDGLEKFATAYCSETGIAMDVLTDLPGVQLYTGNFVNGEHGKDGVVYGKRSAFCLETQYFPNSVNEKNFETPVFDANEEYKTTTIYRFYIK